MFIITNDFDSSAKEIIETYALRWLIENNIQENIDFFSLNALSSPVIICPEHIHALKELSNRAQMTVETVDQALEAVEYILR